MLIIKDRVMENVTSAPGTGSITPGGAVSSDGSFQTFSSVCANGDTFDYEFKDATNGVWEIGLGTFVTGSPNTITRTAVYANSSGTTSALNLTGTTGVVFITSPAYRLSAVGISATGGSRMVASRFYGTFTASTSSANITNVITWSPILLPGGAPIKTMNFAATSATAAGNVNLGLYSDNNGAPGALLASVTAIAVAATTAANYTGTFSSPLSVGPGLYWMAFQGSGVTVTVDGNQPSTMAISGWGSLSAALGNTRDGYASSISYASGLPSSNPTVTGGSQWARIVLGT